MTAIEEWVAGQVKIAIGDMRESCEPDWGDTCASNEAQRQLYRDNYAEDWRLLEQRIACLLIQARALECRHLAAELVMSTDSPAARVTARASMDRSHKLEAIGLMLANQWPIPDGAAEPAQPAEVIEMPRPDPKRNRICKCGHLESDHEPECEAVIEDTTGDGRDLGCGCDKFDPDEQDD